MAKPKYRFGVEWDAGVVRRANAYWKRLNLGNWKSLRLTVLERSEDLAEKLRWVEVDDL